MQKKFRPRRDFVALKKRRLNAARLFAKGYSQADAARELGVSRQSVSLWHKEWTAGGSAALKGAGRAGRKPRLGAAQLHSIRSALLAGPAAQGYANELWTLARIARLVRKLTGVQYHTSQIWRILKGTLGYSAQRPTTVARRKNPEAIADFRNRRWQLIKKKPAG